MLEICESFGWGEGSGLPAHTAHYRPSASDHTDQRQGTLRRRSVFRQDIERSFARGFLNVDRITRQGKFSPFNYRTLSLITNGRDRVDATTTKSSSPPMDHQPYPSSLPYGPLPFCVLIP